MNCNWTRLVGLAALLAMPGIAVPAECRSGDPESLRSSPMDFKRVLFLEEEPTTSANASIGDLNGDGLLDIVLIKGRHWPVANRILLGDGSGKFDKAMRLGDIEDRSYTGALADIDGDGDLDIVVSNDKPDPNYVYVNDGGGEYSVSSTFGQSDWGTRNISLADVNHDGLLDIVVANRGPLSGPSPNYLCLNLGEGRFATACQPFSEESATTITALDVNRDGLNDFVVPSRDGAQSHVYLSTSRETIALTPVPFGAPYAAIRAAEVADFNCDGIMDIVAIHTGNSEGGDGVVDGRRSFRGATLYFGREDGGYSDAVAITESSDMPYALAIDDLNRDGAMDIIVGHVEAGTRVLFNAGDAERFVTIELDDNDGATYGFDTADLDRDGHLDIVVAKSGARNRVLFGSRTSID